MGAPVAWVHHGLEHATRLVAQSRNRLVRCGWNRGYGAVGAANALTYDIPPLPAAIMGVFTACFGGVVRDVLAGEPSIILRPELYVTAAALPAEVFVVLASFRMEPAVAVAFTMGFGLRALAIVKQLRCLHTAAQADL
jgi:uncharacterized membrane protein YeiH